MDVVSWFVLLFVLWILGLILERLLGVLDTYPEEPDDGGVNCNQSLPDLSESLINGLRRL